MVVDFSAIGAAVKPLIDQLDHRNLNEIIPDEYHPTTEENLACYLYNQIQGRPVTIYAVEVYETATCCARYSLDEVLAHLRHVRHGGLYAAGQ
jgi:6-pyruvoyl-tetrahydropterin synthase